LASFPHLQGPRALRSAHAGTRQLRIEGNDHDPTNKKLWTIAGVTTAAAFGVVTPLTADASISQCNSNLMCAWGNNDFLWLIAERHHGKTY
jgi:hypothetical protein